MKNDIPGMINSSGKHKDFFVSYKETFIRDVLALIPDAGHGSTQKTGRSADSLYEDIITLQPKRFEADVSAFCSAFGNETDAKNVISKSFIKMAGAYSAFLYDNGPDLRYLAALVEVQNECLKILDKIHFQNKELLIFRTITAADSKSAGFKKILDRMRLLKDKDGKVRLLNFYKGVPITYESSVAEVGAETVRLNVHKYQTVVIDRQKGTFIEMEVDGPPEWLKANVLSVSLPGKIVDLFNFININYCPDRRKTVRVRPEETISVMITAEGKTISGEMYDISSGGISLYSLRGDLIRAGSVISSSFSLPGPDRDNTNITLPGNIINIISDNTLFKYVLEFSPDRGTESIISQYVSRRQFEIIKELKGFYEQDSSS